MDTILLTWASYLQPWASCSHLMCLCSPSSIIWYLARAFMLMRHNVAAGIGSNEQGEYCRAALQRSDRKEPRYKWPTLLNFTFTYLKSYSVLALKTLDYNLLNLSSSSASTRRWREGDSVAGETRRLLLLGEWHTAQMTFIYSATALISAVICYSM